MAQFQPKLTVVTIVYNNVRDIERTMLTVINQTYPNIEYIIVDGLSTDGTLDVIAKYKDKVTKLISEKDKGLYDAMNKGMAASTGDYFIFMNSGDEFFDKDTVTKVFATAPDADIYYGETEMINDELEVLGQRRHKIPQALNWRSFKFGMSVSHQAIYVSRHVAEPYDLRYQLSSDIDWIIRALKKAKTIVRVDAYVARYLVGGISKKKHKQSLAERFDVMKRYYGLLPTVFYHIVIGVKMTWHKMWHKTMND